MANWAYTTYHVIGKEEEVADLYSKIEQLSKMKEPLNRTDSGICGLVVW